MRIRMEAGREGKKESERERVNVCVREESLFARSCVEVCAFIRTRTYICTRTYVCRMPEHVRMYVCVCVCAVCTCINGTSPLAIYTQTHTDTQTNAHAHTHKCKKTTLHMHKTSSNIGIFRENRRFFPRNTGLFCGKQGSTNRALLWENKDLLWKHRIGIFPSLLQKFLCRDLLGNTGFFCECSRLFSVRKP